MCEPQKRPGNRQRKPETEKAGFNKTFEKEGKCRIMKMKTRLFAAFLALTMLISALPVNAYDVGDEASENPSKTYTVTYLVVNGK